MNISEIGIQYGQRIQASKTASQNRGCIIELYNEDYLNVPPVASKKESILYKPQRSRVESISPLSIRDTLNNYKFFQHMNTETRLEWLLDNSTDINDLYLDDCNLYIKFIKLDGKFFLENLTKEQLDEISTGIHSIQKVYNMFPRKQNSKAKKHTLIFRPDNWDVVMDAVSTSIYTGWSLYANDMHVTQTQFPINDLNISLQKSSLGVMFPDITTPKLTLEVVCDGLHAKHILTLPNYLEIIHSISDKLSFLTVSMLKSLLQKLMRFGCKYVHMDAINYPVEYVFVYTFVTLCLSSGTFNPNIQRYVRGYESACKRLAVTINEDSYSENPIIVAEMLTCALHSQLNQNYNLSLDLMIKFIIEGLACQASKKYYVYNVMHADYSVEYAPTNPYNLQYMLLKDLGSFAGDIELTYRIYENNGKYVVADANEVSVMQISHFLDQHCYPYIGYYIPYYTELTNESQESIEIIKSELNSAFPKLFACIWNYKVSFNSRKTNMYNELLYEYIEKAQCMLWNDLAYGGTIPNLNDNSSNDFIFNQVIPYNTIASILGYFECSVGGKAVYVVLNNELDKVVIRKPTRTTDSVELTVKQKEKAIEMFDNKLRMGAYIDTQVGVLAPLSGMLLKLVDDKYVFYSEDNVITWEDFTNQIIRIKTFNNEIDILEYGGVYCVHANGLACKQHSTLFQSLLEFYPLNVIRRVLYYLTTKSSKIVMNPISRDGSDSTYTLFIEDIGAYHFLRSLSYLYGFCLECRHCTFIIKNSAYLTILRDIINEYCINLTSNKETEGLQKWNYHISDTRTLRDYQQVALDKLIFNAKKKGSLLHLDMGLGKTFIVMSYIVWLIENELASNYIVYTLPTSCLKAIEQEIQYFGFVINILDPRKLKSSNSIIRKYCINVVQHDHLRYPVINEQLQLISNDMLFIVDEVHKTLNQTKRTSYALQCARSSKHFIGLTGTLIQGYKMENLLDLIKWLELVVDFEVTPNNYLVAIGSLISNTIKTNVKVTRLTKDIPIESDEYLECIPVGMGGRGKTLNLKCACIACYTVILENMLYLIKGLVNKGEGCFVVLKDIKMLKLLETKLIHAGILNIFSIGKDNLINYDNSCNLSYAVILTTMSYSVGYSVIKMRIMITSVYFSNESTRSQMQSRIVRYNQLHPEVTIITLTAGILSYILERYDKSRNLSDIVKELSKFVIVENV